MIELRGNIWDLAGPHDIICITTNGSVTKSGAAVMGRGIALEAKRRYPGIENILGRNIQLYGNIVQYIIDGIYSFPVKCRGMVPGPNRDQYVVNHMRGKFKDTDDIPGWALKAHDWLIRDSCVQLVELLQNDARDVYIGRPGVGAGELPWEDVKSIIEPVLVDDKFKVCTF